MKKHYFWIGIIVYLLGQAIVGVSLHIKINAEFQRVVSNFSEQVDCQLTSSCEDEEDF